MKNDERFASENAAFRKNRIGSIGDSARSSQVTKAASSTAPAANARTISGDDQPCSLALTRPHTIANSPELTSPRPARQVEPAARAVALGEPRPRERDQHEPDRDVQP